MFKRYSLFILSILMFTLQACNLQLVDAADTDGLVLTITAQAKILEGEAVSPTPTYTPVIIIVTATGDDNNPAVPPQETATYTPEGSSANVPPPASGAPTVTVSVATNCRTGPGQAYPSIYGHPVGVSAEVVGKNTSTNYWIIKIPGSNNTCWLWGQYATVTGDTSGLQNVAIPPTPTLTITPTFTPTKVVLQPPAAPSNLSQTSTCTKTNGPPIDTWSFNGTFTWQDNSNNEDGFRIYVYDPGFTVSGDRLIGTTGSNGTSYGLNLTVVAPTPTLRIEAYNNAGASARVSLNIPGTNCPP